MRTKIILASLVISFMALPALADPVDPPSAPTDLGDFQGSYQSGLTSGRNTHISFTGWEWDSDDESWEQVSGSSYVVAGLYTFKNDGTKGGLGNNIVTWDGGYYHAMCVDVLETVANRQYDVVAPGDVPNHTQLAMGADRADRLGRLWGEYYETARDGSNDQKAAFQLAAWEIVYEDWDEIGELDLQGEGASDWFYATDQGTARGMAETWIGAIDVFSDTWSGEYQALAGLHEKPGGDYQDFVVPIPVPGAALLGVLGLGLVGWLKRRMS